MEGLAVSSMHFVFSSTQAWLLPIHFPALSVPVHTAPTTTGLTDEPATFALSDKPLRCADHGLACFVFTCTFLHEPRPQQL